MDRLQFWGRWASLGTLRSYLQEAMSYWVWFTLPGGLQERLADWLKTYSHCLSSPPSVSLETFLAAVTWRPLMVMSSAAL